MISIVRTFAARPLSAGPGSDVSLSGNPCNIVYTLHIQYNTDKSDVKRKIKRKKSNKCLTQRERGAIIAGKGEDSMERIIFHCDLNNFYASAELLSHPEMRHLPVAVCGDPASRHGIVLAKNEVAKRYAVKTGETIWQAKQKCPNLALLPPHHEVYRHYSCRVNAIYRRYTDRVEPFGIDESWLDVTGTLHLFGGDARALADRIRNEVRRELGLTISVGVSFNKVFAKLGSDYKKPDATTVILRDRFRDIVWPLPVTSLLYVGRTANRVFEKFGIRTIGQLAAFDRDTLYTLLGKHGSQLHDYACGLDEAPVALVGAEATPKSISCGLTFSRNLQGREEIRAGMTLLADQVAARLRKHDMKAGGVALAIRDPGFRNLSRQRQLSQPTFLGRGLALVAMELAEECWNMDSPVRALTVTALYLRPSQETCAQMSLFDDGADQKQKKLEKLAGAMDTIRDRYGAGAIRPASCPVELGKPQHAPPPGTKGRGLAICDEQTASPQDTIQRDKEA